MYVWLFSAVLWLVILLEFRVCILLLLNLSHRVVVPRCVIKGPNRREVPVEVIDNGDGTYDAKFVPEHVGRHEIDVLFGGAPVPGSPFSAKAEKPVDVDKIKCSPKDRDNEPLVNEELVYAIDARPAESTPGEGLLNGSLLTPSGEKEPVRIKDNRDGTYDVSCVPKEPGPHELSVSYDDVPLVGSPFKFDAVEGGADKVKAYGKGKFEQRSPFVNGYHTNCFKTCVARGNANDSWLPIETFYCSKRAECSVTLKRF